MLRVKWPHKGGFAKFIFSKLGLYISAAGSMEPMQFFSKGEMDKESSTTI